MARENTVYLYGRLIADPKNRMDKENNPISSRMILQTLRRSYANDEMILQGKIIPDTPIVISRNPELIERMHLSELEKGDFVYVKGTVCTMETRKRYICPRCGHENVKQEGVIVYIDPIYVRKTENDFNEHIKIIEQYLEERIWNLSQFSEDYRPMEVNRIVQILPSCKELRAYLIQQYPGKRFIKENMDDVGNHLSNYKKALEAGDDVSDFKDIFLGDKQSLEQYAFHHLKNRQEISNQVFIMGTLCMEPEYYANEDSRLQTCQFPIASNRLRRIKEDGADKKTDYPWVKCFGPMAEQHSICLHTNSTIYINGAIEARDIEIEMCCEQCQQNFLAKSSSIEIVPYHIEYIDDCIIPESDRAYEEDGLMEGRHMKQNKNLLSSRLTENRMNDQNIQSKPDSAIQEKSNPVLEKKLNKIFDKGKKEEEPAYFQYADSSNLTDQNLEDYAEIQDNTKMKRGNLHTKIINFVLIAGCIYLLVLIFGAAVTKYQYNSDGKAVPEKMSVDDIRQKHNFDTILTQYEYCRSLYEKTLLLDYRVAQGQEDTLEIAPEYEALLDDVQNLSVKTDAISVDTKYDQVKSMMVNWIKNDIAVYLQNISAAISENNTEKANNALQDKDRVYDDFFLITQNIVALGSSISGADLTDIKSWTPEDYVDQEINGK